ncbi:hypothetical protein [Oceanobacter sp. 3_MG-2023]|uniref:hypothetical protein n=1 Tax=Oceanobacter sp. 3_MG-2023 TaxID=3062622 RepID=UPI002735CE5B|nr:hypothetical protein [Oceanobacter sp. 3_MG-2023]MDP2505474.1 hypothetical protein [Oceanobacter sp. 3_MG-2023]
MEISKLMLAIMAASTLTLTACGGNSSSGSSDNQDQSQDTDSGDTDSGDTDSGDTDSGDTDSGDTDSGDTDSPVLTGTAATGLAIDGTVFVYDADGRQTNVIIEDDGSFSVNVDGMTPPFMLEARPDDTSTAIQYSFAEAADITVNVTPLTTLALFLANDQQSLAALVSAWDDEAESFDETALAAAEDVILANFADQFEERALDPQTYDLFNNAFRANRTGFDAVLDDVRIVFDMDEGSFEVDVDEQDYDFDEDAEFGTDPDTGTDPDAGSGTDTEPDTTPDSFSFPAQDNRAPNSTSQSATVTLSGFDGSLTLTVTNGTLIVNSQSVGESASVSAGDQLAIQQQAPNDFGSTGISTITLGDYSTTFEVTTRAADTSPVSFTLPAVTDVAPATQVSTDQITLTGFEGQLALAFDQGYVVVNGAIYSSGVMVTAGDTVYFRLTSSGDYGATVTSTITLGDYSTTFAVTTRAIDNTPDAISFDSLANVTPGEEIFSNVVTVTGFDEDATISITNGQFQINGGAWLTSGTIREGDTLRLLQNVPDSFGTTTDTTVTINGNSYTFSTITRTGDTTPDSFNLVNLSNAEPDTRYETDTVTLSGFEGSPEITVTHGELRINGTLSGTSATVSVGDQISVVQQSSADFETTVVSTVTIGDFSTSFETTTRAESADVDPFTFEQQEDLEPGVVAISNAVTVSGFDTPQTFTLRNGVGSLIVNGTDMGTSAVVASGDSIQLSVTTYTNFGWNANAVVEFSNGSAMFIAGTRAAITTPDPFSFASVTEVEPGVEVVSAPISFSGLEDATRIQVTNGVVRSSRYPGQDLTSLSVWPNDTITVVHTSSNLYDTDTVTTVSTQEGYGSVSATFTSTTKTAASSQTDPIMDLSWNLGQDKVNALALPVNLDTNGSELYLLKNSSTTSSLMNVTPGSADRELATLQALSSTTYEGLAVALLEQGSTSEQLIFSCDTATQPARITARLASDPTAVSSLELSDTVSANLAGRASALQEGMAWSLSACDDLSVADVSYNATDDTFQIKLGVSGAGKMDTDDYHQIAVFEYSYDLNAADASTAMSKTLATPLYRLMFGTQEYKAVELSSITSYSYRFFAMFENNGSDTYNYLRMYYGGGSSVDLNISPINYFTGNDGSWDVADIHIWKESETAYHLYLTSATMGLYEVVFDPTTDTKTSERLHNSGDQQFCKGAITGSISGSNPTLWCHDATDEGKLIEFDPTE